MLCVTLFVVVHQPGQGHHQYKVGSRQILKSLEYYRWSAAIYRKYGLAVAGVEGGGQENVTGEGEKNWVMHRHAGCVMLRERHAR